MKITPTLFTAVAAGAFAGIVMPTLWRWLAADSMLLVVAFLGVVALPAHAFVVGFARSQTAPGGAIDAALLKRVVAWLVAAVAATAISQGLLDAAHAAPRDIALHGSTRRSL